MYPEYFADRPVERLIGKGVNDDALGRCLDQLYETGVSELFEVLLMIMTCCLMVYAALEHKIREELKAKDPYFPNLKYKPSQNPTARWVFFCFQGIDILTISEEQQLVLNIEERNRIIIDYMGPTYPQIYS